MSAKHTPGEWEAHGLAVYTKDKREHWLSPISPKASLIAEVCSHDSVDDYFSAKNNNPPSFQEAEANARLIASAPELLAALEALLESAICANASQNWATGLNDEPASFDQARAAIRKARGEA